MEIPIYLLISHDLLPYVDGSLPCPPRTIIDSSGSLLLNSNFTAWIKSDQTLQSWITATLTPDFLQDVHSLPTSQNVWLMLEKRFVAQSMAKEMYLKFQLQTLKKGRAGRGGCRQPFYPPLALIMSSQPQSSIASSLQHYNSSFPSPSLSLFSPFYPSMSTVSFTHAVSPSNLPSAGILGAALVGSFSPDDCILFVNYATSSDTLQSLDNLTGKTLMSTKSSHGFFSIASHCVAPVSLALVARTPADVWHFRLCHPHLWLLLNFKLLGLSKFLKSHILYVLVVN
ncbi:hypothetical protein ACH5RR_002869 [Cinchona calisaya]|uniref:GAG-pre-integrase domain-containing protein n=1 Tax=Cinchona calisaya TaxID=153742 RepID=A0ABD3ATI5_9GENT